MDPGAVIADEILQRSGSRPAFQSEPSQVDVVLGGNCCLAAVYVKNARPHVFFASLAASPTG